MHKLLDIVDISFSVGDRQITAAGVLKEGHVLKLRGPSGSGKTTLLRILARLREPDGGRAFLRDVPWLDITAVDWRCKVHYLAQKPVIFDGTVLDNLMRPFELAAVRNRLRFDRERAANLAERLLLPEKVLHQDARTLSGGEASRVALIRAMLVEPEVLLLDEPLAALDSDAAAAVLEVIDEWVDGTAQKGVILVSHVGNLARLPSLDVMELGCREGDRGE